MPTAKNNDALKAHIRQEISFLLSRVKILRIQLEALENEWPEELGKPIESLMLSVRTYSALKRGGIDGVNELATFIATDPDKIRSMRGIGNKAFDEIIVALQKLHALYATSN